jgi:hypothetical protein
LRLSGRTLSSLSLFGRLRERSHRQTFVRLAGGRERRESVGLNPSEQLTCLLSPARDSGVKSHA